jgi:uncharacterized protein (DUF2225 family)
MGKFKVLYLIGELNRRLENYEEALRYLSDVITSPIVDKRLKDLAIDQKDLIRAVLKSQEVNEENNSPPEIAKNEKQGLFSRFLKSKTTRN